MSKATSILKSMFSLHNSVGDIIEAIIFANEWSKKLNIDILSLMKGVTKSNYTKLMVEQSELHQTYIKYRDLGVKDLYFRFNEYEILGEKVVYSIIYSGADQLDKKNKVYRKDKFLKSCFFKDPNDFVDFKSL
jgi:hypothetical protein